MSRLWQLGIRVADIRQQRDFWLPLSLTYHLHVSNIYLIHTDGGSRGNPGPSASGYVIEGPDIPRVEHGEYLGVATNNVAEYTAPILALAKLKSLLGTERSKQAQVQVHADSELLVKQVNGQYKVKNPELMKLFVQLYNARQDFASVTFTHLRREKNTAADRMVNEALDRQNVPGLDL
jgi:ribonuclease HI